MPDPNVDRLSAARERLVSDRRSLADELAKGYMQEKSEELMKHFNIIQDTIEAIDRAISDELARRELRFASGGEQSITDLEND